MRFQTVWYAIANISEETAAFLFETEMIDTGPSRMLALPTELQGITSQNIKIDNSYRPLIHKQ
jgi:hypothetical protein